MSKETQLQKSPQLPSIQELYCDTPERIKENDLNILLNQEPKDEWLKLHPIAKNAKGQPLKYIPIERIEYLLTKIFIRWHVEIRTVQLIANSVVCTVRLHYQNPVDGVWDFHDGVGAAPLQTNAGSGATDFNAVKSAAVQIGAPAAESYAIKDAAEKLGKLFGKDVNRVDQINYDLLAKSFNRDAAITQALEAVAFEPFNEELPL